MTLDHACIRFELFFIVLHPFYFCFFSSLLCFTPLVSKPATTKDLTERRYGDIIFDMFLENLEGYAWVVALDYSRYLTSSVLSIVLLFVFVLSSRF